MNSVKGKILNNVFRSAPFAENSAVNYLIITNSSTVTVLMNVYVVTVTAKAIHIAPKDIQLKANESYIDNNIVILKGESLQISSTQSIDYYFSIL